MQYQLQQVQNKYYREMYSTVYTFMRSHSTLSCCFIILGSKSTLTAWDGQKRSVSEEQSQSSYIMDVLQGFVESYIQQQEDGDPNEHFKNELQKYFEENEGGQQATRVQQVESETNYGRLHRYF